MSQASEWASTHLCQGERADCPCLYIHYGEDGQEVAAFPGRKLEKYRVYCTRDGKLRTICANLASWTGLTPKWCAIRSALRGSSSSGEPLDSKAQGSLILPTEADASAGSPERAEGGKDDG